MEPDFEKLITKKVRQAEKLSVQWNKRHVWERLDLELNTRRKPAVFRYGAAAAIALLTYVGFQILYYEDSDTSVATMVRHQPSHTAAEKQESPVKETKAADKKVQHQASNKLALLPGQTLRSDKIQKQTEPVLETELNIASSYTEIVVEEDLITRSEDLPSIDRVIRPIVGIILPAPINNNVSKTKRKRPKKVLRLLESEDPVPWESSSNAVVFARRK